MKKKKKTGEYLLFIYLNWYSFLLLGFMVWSLLDCVENEDKYNLKDFLKFSEDLILKKA